MSVNNTFHYVLQSVRSSFARSWSSVRMERQVSAAEGHTSAAPTLSHLQEEAHADHSASHS